MRRRAVVLGGLAGAMAATARRAGGREGPARRLRIGQIGTAHGHATKIEVYRASADYEVVGVVEPDPERRARAAGLPAFQGLPWLERDALLATPGLDAVLVETAVSDLLDQADAVIAAGKHLHLDKPAGASLPRFERLLAEAARGGLLVQMGYMYRYSPAIVRLRELLTAGALGEVFEVHAVMSKVVPDADRRRFAPFSGGMMFELGGHLIDLVVGLLGKPERVTPYLRRSRPDDHLADNTLAVLEYPGALASIRSTALEVDGSSRRHLVVCGTQGTLHIQPLDNPRARLTLARPHGDLPAGAHDLTFPEFRRYVADAADMARILRKEKAADFSPQHDRNVQETLLRAAGMPVDV